MINEKKVICYVSHYLIEHDELFLRSLCEEGYETHLVAFTHIDLPKNILSINNLIIHYKKIPDFFNSRKYSYPFLVPSLNKVIKKIKPNVLHSGWTPKDGLMSSLSNFHPHLSMPWGSEIIIHPYENILYKKINNFVFNNSDHITCDSNHVKKLIMEDYNVKKSKITVFPWGIEKNFFNLDSINKKSKKLELGWDNKTVLIMTRKFEKFYRIDSFISIFNECLKLNKDLRLFLIGTGSKEKVIRAKIKKYNIENYIYMPGWVLKNEMNDYLLSSDIYVSNSYTDGSSVSLLEAMMCGLSPIVTKIESIEEWVENNYNGFLVDINKPNDFINKILILSKSKNKLNIFKKRNLDIANKRLNWENNFNILQNIYNKLTNG